MRISDWSSDVCSSDLQFGAGISVKPNARLTIGFDFVRTNWSGVKAFSEQAGFGWRDHNIYKFGASYDLTPGLTVRAGTSLAKRHFGRDFVLANVNTPGTASRSLTFGFTTRLGEIGRESCRERVFKYV